MGEFLVTTGDSSNFRFINPAVLLRPNPSHSRSEGRHSLRDCFGSCCRAALKFVNSSRALRPETPQFVQRLKGNGGCCPKTIDMLWPEKSWKIMAAKSFLNRFTGASQKPTKIIPEKRISKEKMIVNKYISKKMMTKKKKTCQFTSPPPRNHVHPFKAVESLSRTPAVGPFALGPGSWLDPTCHHDIVVTCKLIHIRACIHYIRLD